MIRLILRTKRPDRAPIPADLVARIYPDYERAKDRAKRVDFEDMLALTVELLESDADAARIVRGQKTWISVDEYQDTNPLGKSLLELWIGESRDLAVVGDPDQTIYTQHLRHARLPGGQSSLKRTAAVGASPETPGSWGVPAGKQAINVGR